MPDPTTCQHCGGEIERADRPTSPYCSEPCHAKALVEEIHHERYCKQVAEAAFVAALPPERRAAGRAWLDRQKRKQREQATRRDEPWSQGSAAISWMSDTSAT